MLARSILCPHRHHSLAADPLAADACKLRQLGLFDAPTPAVVAAVVIAHAARAMPLHFGRTREKVRAALAAPVVPDADAVRMAASWAAHFPVGALSLLACASCTCRSLPDEAAYPVIVQPAAAWVASLSPDERRALVLTPEQQAAYLNLPLALRVAMPVTENLPSLAAGELAHLQPFFLSREPAAAGAGAGAGGSSGGAGVELMRAAHIAIPVPFAASPLHMAAPAALARLRTQRGRSPRSPQRDETLTSTPAGSWPISERAILLKYPFFIL